MESGKYVVSIDQSEYIQQNMYIFDILKSHAVATSVVTRRSESDKGDEPSNEVIRSTVLQCHSG